MIPTVKIQRGTLPPLAHSVGSLLLCRYGGRDILCVKTYLKFIDVEISTKYFGTLQCPTKTCKFEIRKEIVAVDGEMASFAIKCKGKYGLKKYLRSIAPREGNFCNDSDAYIVTERGQSIRIYAVRFKPLEGRNRFGVYLERGMVEELSKGCPIYNKDNKVIGLIKCKNYGILWFVSWFQESKLLQKYHIECIEECPPKDDAYQDYQSIETVVEQLEKVQKCGIACIEERPPKDDAYQDYQSIETVVEQLEKDNGSHYGRRASKSITDISDNGDTSVSGIYDTDGSSVEAIVDK